MTKKVIQRILIACFTSQALLACASSGGPLPDSVNVPTSDKSKLPMPDVAQIIASSDLRVGPLDILAISVFGVPELKGDYQVDYEGQLKIPLIGQLPVTGYTATELSVLLENKLSKDYLQNPDVTVLMKKPQDRLITIDGSVEKPGQYPVQGKMTLLQAVAMSGGTDEYAELKRVIVIREVGGERKVAGFNLKDIRRGMAEDPTVYPNDIIVVDGSEVKRNYQEFLRSVPLLGLFLAL